MNSPKTFSASDEITTTIRCSCRCLHQRPQRKCNEFCVAIAQMSHAQSQFLQKEKKTGLKNVLLRKDQKWTKLTPTKIITDKSIDFMKCPQFLNLETNLFTFMTSFYCWLVS